jgi:hypothetical protein
MESPDVRQLRGMYLCVSCLPFSSAAEDAICAPFKASQRRFEQSSTAIIKPALPIVHDEMQRACQNPRAATQ